MLGGQEKSQLEQLENLLVVSENYRDDLEFFRKRWTSGTCDWIFSNSSFNNWLDDGEEGPTMLWLHALPASGKSILSSYVVNHLLETSICAYYFFRFGDQSKRSLSTCLRTIAFQIAEQLPQFRRALQDIRFPTKTAEKTDAKTLWEKIFVGVLFKIRVKTTMFWIIDALDESDHPQFLVELMQGIHESSVPIKVLLVSRQTPELISTFDRLSIVVPCVYLPLRDTKKDIRVFVEKEVQYMHAPSEFKLEIVEKLVANAVGNFLWASLALTEVMKCNTQEDLDTTLEGIPSGMEQMYQRMEGKIIENTRSRDQQLGQMILTWTTCSRRPLSLKELAQALQPEFSIKLDLTFTISRVCGQFVVVDSSDRLAMVHQTARDHIIATDSALGVNVTESHEKLLMKCLAVLEERNQRRDRDRLLGNQEFVNYAMASWAFHLNMTSAESNAPLLLLSKFLRGNSVLAWIVSLAQQNQLKLLVYSSKSMNSYVRRKRRCQATTNPLLHPLREIDLVESWATDFLKLLGKFGQNLMASPLSIYHQIPPFCPKNSMIYRQFEQNISLPRALSVEGVSKNLWDDSLAKLSLGSGSQTLVIICSGDHFGILTAAGMIVLYNSTTFEVKQNLRHGERVCAMSFSNCSNLLATYGFRTTKVWSVKNGQVLHQIRNPMGSRAFTIKFSISNTELVIGSNDRLIRSARLADKDPTWSTINQTLLKDDTALDRPVHNVPWRIEFNSDVSCVAIAYRGSPLCVWAMDPPELIGRCMRNQDYAGNAWTVVDQVIWHPKSDEVLGLYMGGQVFRWNPYSHSQQELQAEASIIASSPEGKFFVTGDSNGTIKLYNFHHFALIYQLSCENMINDICFSPDSKRLYDIRGQFCNIWEPNALLRADETGEQDVEDASDVASNPTAAVSESFVDVRDQITAVAIQFRGRYQAIGNEAGVVSVVDALEGDHVTTQLWRSPVTLSIEHLEWSNDGNYLACAELTGRIVVHKVQLENDLSWSAASVFSVKLKVDSAGIQQIMLNHDGTKLLVKNGSCVNFWTIGLPSRSEVCDKSIASPNTHWINHPSDPALVLGFGLSLLRVYRWDDLEEIASFAFNASPLISSENFNLANEEADNTLSAVHISSIFPNPSGSHLLVSTGITTSEGHAQFTSVFEAPVIKPSPISPPQITITSTPVPQEIQKQIEIPIGIIPKQRLIFIDKDYWMCSWRFGANVTTEKVQRYYFLPKDWLSVEYLKLCALLADGRFLIPNNGELAIVISTGLNHG